MLFDTHAHMDDHAFDADREALLDDLPNQGIALVMNPGCSLESSRNVDRLTKEYDFLYGAVGSHPDVADEVSEEVREEYRTLCRQNPKIKAIGEIGLDYYYEDIPREIQKNAFRMQMALAQELDMPVIVHDREAHGDCFETVLRHPGVRGVFHSYSGSAEMARELTRRGWYISFSGTLTFKNARRVREAALAVPRDRLLVETDAPYLAPHPMRGKLNHSGLLVHTLSTLAELWECTPEEAAAITAQNGKNLFFTP